MKKLESLDVWKQANALARAAYRLTLRGPLQRHYGIANQIRRAAISIPSNMAEGYALGTTPQLVRCLRIAQGSTAELLCQLRIVHDLNLAPHNDTSEALALCDRALALLIGTLRGLTKARDQHASPFTLHASRPNREEELS